MAKLSFTARRVLSGAALALLLLSLVNYRFFHLLGQFDKDALIASSVLLGVCVLFIGPTLQEQREYRARPKDTK